MLSYYQLARGGIRLMFASLAFALFNPPLGNSTSKEQLVRAALYKAPR
jgi:hypothetical protein